MEKIKAYAILDEKGQVWDKSLGLGDKWIKTIPWILPTKKQCVELQEKFSIDSLKIVKVEITYLD